MPGLVPGIHESRAVGAKNVDGRDKPGHDGEYDPELMLRDAPD